MYSMLRTHFCLLDESLAKAKQELIDTREEMSAWKCQYDSVHRKYKIQEASSSCFQVSRCNTVGMEALYSRGPACN